MVLTRELLTQYGKLEREIRRIEDKLEYYSKLQVPSEYGVVKGSAKNFPYTEKTFVFSGSDVKSDEARQHRLRELLVLLQEKRNNFIELGIEVAFAIEEIDDIEMRQIIENKFINGMTDQQIGDIIGVERSVVSRKLTNFFEKQAQNT